jgi:hypothetical protein
MWVIRDDNVLSGGIVRFHRSYALMHLVSRTYLTCTDELLAPSLRLHAPDEDPDSPGATPAAPESAEGGKGFPDSHTLLTGVQERRPPPAPAPMTRRCAAPPRAAWRPLWYYCAPGQHLWCLPTPRPPPQATARPQPGSQLLIEPLDESDAAPPPAAAPAAPVAPGARQGEGDVLALGSDVTVGARVRFTGVDTRAHLHAAPSFQLEQPLRLEGPQVAPFPAARPHCLPALGVLIAGATRRHQPLSLTHLSVAAGGAGRGGRGGRGGHRGMGAGAAPAA